MNPTFLDINWSSFVEAITDSSVKLAHLIPAKDNQLVTDVNQLPAILYSYEEGQIFKYPNPTFPIIEATQVLAELHKFQLSKPLQLSEEFSFDDVFNIWH